MPHVPLRTTLLAALAGVLLAGPGRAQFPSSGVNLMGHWCPDEISAAAPTWGTKVWGYTSPSGREYGLLGIWDGTAFIEVTDPGRPELVGFVGGPPSAWRTIRTYQEYAYVVTEGGVLGLGGIQIVDMGQIDAGIVNYLGVVNTPGGPPTTHNLDIDQTSGYLYRIHSQTPIPWVPFGLRYLRPVDPRNPRNPVYVGAWNDEDVHGRPGGHLHLRALRGGGRSPSPARSPPRAASA